MMTFKQLQDAVLERFSESRRSDAKHWIRTVYASLWELEPWTFKQAVATVTVTAGSQTVTGLPADLGIVHLLQDAYGNEKRHVDWVEFNRRWFGDTSTGPCDWTMIGTGQGAQVKVGPASDVTSSSWQLAYEKALGYYPSTTVAATVSLPQASIQVANTSLAPSSGSLLIGGRLVTYTGKDSTHFTGCAGGSGSFQAADAALCVILSGQAGDLYNDTDVPLLPSEAHVALVAGAQSIGQTGENDFSKYMSDDTVQQAVDMLRRCYLIQARDIVETWGG